MKLPLLSSVLVPSVLLLFAGCISHDETVYRDEPRVPVEFENDTAGRLFYEALNQSSQGDRGESTTSVHLPIIFEHKQRVVRGDSYRFNRAVRECDTNRDHRITELEARVFSDQRH